ncbi:MAG: DUF4783 domain-containing protein [Saprospiraceae bacterium]|nr:DUF4783 domain-containing protein [Saprospiraceae bacterium]
MMNLLFAMALTLMINASLADITRAISSGDADALGQYFDQTVEVAVLDQEDVYDKAQAVTVVKQFFAKSQPKGFSQVHQGTSKGADSQYCIGNMTTASGTYRVYVYMKVSGNNFLIQELRFDKE